MGGDGRAVSGRLLPSPILGQVVGIRREEEMFRKHLRFRRMVLGLAFAAMVVPVAPAGAVSLSTYVDNGRVAPASSDRIPAVAPSYLRYHQVGVPVASNTLAFAHATRVQQACPTITPLQAD